MSEVKFTPGPWKSNHPVRNKNGGGFNMAIGSNTCDVCEVYGVEDDECVANAQLIATAPDLYTACQAAHEWFGELPINPILGSRDSRYQVYRLLAEALAKARNES